MKNLIHKIADWFSFKYWLYANSKMVRKYLKKNMDMNEYERKKKEVLDKIREQTRMDNTEKYISIHCGNYTDKEKVIARNSIQIGWELHKNTK